MQSSAHNQLSEYLSSSTTAYTFLNTTVTDGQNASGGTIGESSFSSAQSLHHNRQNTELFWTPSMIGSSGVVSVRQNEPASVFPSNVVGLSSSQIAHGPVFLQSSGSVPREYNFNAGSVPREYNFNAGSVSREYNFNAGLGEQGNDDCQIVERPNIFKSGSSGNVQLPLSNSSSNPYGLHINGYVDGVNRDGRPSDSLAGRHISRKRKGMEGNIGQSSGSGTSNYFQHAESSSWHAVPARQNTGSNLSISMPSQNAIATSQLMQLNPGFEMDIGGIPSEIPPVVSATGTTESSHRNLHLRFSLSQQLDSLPTNVSPAVTAVGPLNYTSPHQSLRITPLTTPLDVVSRPHQTLRITPLTTPLDVVSRPVNYTSPRQSLRITPLNTPLDVVSPAITGGGNLQRQSLHANIPDPRQNLQSSRWNRNSSSRLGSSSSIAIAGDSSGVASHDETRSRSLQRNILDHPMFIPSGMRDSTQPQNNWGLTNGSSIAGNVVAGANPASAPSASRVRNSPQYSRRVSELVRRSLSGGQNNNTSSGNAASAQGMANLPAGQGHHLSHSRSAALLGTFGIPHSLRNLAAGTEGRGRLMSEIRNVLAQMRRGEGLRFEDIMILDQSGYFGMSDHDGHRDMRLDIDNMSYEELLALGDRIGYVNTGLSEEKVMTCLKKWKYAAATTGQKESEPCCICQEEYVDGDDLGKLKCGHDFHTECIKQWLTRKNSCPICKTTTMNTKEKS